MSDIQYEHTTEESPKAQLGDYLYNLEALNNPKPGDYWHERFTPYFMVVHCDGDKITVLNALPDKGINAKVSSIDGWTFDVKKSMVVNRQWMADLVKYRSMDGFCADVRRGSERLSEIVSEWTRVRAKQLVEELRSLGPEATHQALMNDW